MCCEEIRVAFNAADKCIQNNALQVEEDHKKFKILPKQGSTDVFCRIHVDGCLITNKTRQKCDYWFRQCNQEKIQNYFVEFKGQDIQDGFNQIVETIAQVREKGIPLQQSAIHGIVVCNKVPLTTVELQKIKERFVKNYGMSFLVKSKEYVLSPDPIAPH